MKKFTGAVFCLFLMAILASCSKTISSEEITGTWEQQLPDDVYYFAGSIHNFTFYDDRTFELRIELFSDVVYPDSDCQNNRTDFIAGAYQLDGNEIILSAHYTTKDFEEIKANCKGDEVYNHRFKYSYKKGKLILDPGGRQTIDLARK